MPIASPAKTSVVQCASKTIRVAATRPPMVQTKGAARGAAPAIADAVAPTCIACPEGKAS